MQGRLHSFQSLGTVDGPGVRSVVFVQGCALRCPYCHNPDTWDINAGTLVDAQDVFSRICRYKSYFGREGGVTVSGGEPLLQPEFVTELFALCKKDGISTALDTAGVRLDDKVEALLDVTDIVLLDIKYATDELYRKYIGVPLSTVLRFLDALEARKIRVIVRQVVTPGVNDTKADMLALKSMTDRYTCIEKIELLPFLKLCAEKYESMGINFPFGDKPAATAEQTQELAQYLR